MSLSRISMIVSIQDCIPTTLLKIFKGAPEFSIGDNVNPCPIDKPYISLDNMIETQFLLLSLQGESKFWSKKFLIKQSLLKFMAQIS